MTIIGFEDISFKIQENNIRGTYYERYYFDIPKEELDKLGSWELVEGDIKFQDISEKKAWNKVSRLVNQGLQNLTHTLYNKPTILINEASGIPLIGSNEYGIIDRGSNILEIKPLTGCNFNCIFCSVDEGRNKKTHDYIIELDYMLEIAEWIAQTKEHPVEFNIGPQGEPLLYPRIVELIKGLKTINNVKVVSINTNGSLLNKKLIDKLAEAGLTRINLSLPSLNQELANKLAGTFYPLERVLDMIKYCQEKKGNKINILLAPLYIPKYNEQELDGLVKLSKTIKSDYPSIGIQNYLNYPKGRNIVKQAPWEEFYKFIKELETKNNVILKSSMEDFGIFNELEITKPFKKNQTIEAIIVMPGRYPKEVVAAAGIGENARAITIMNASNQTIGKRIKVKIIRDKHNIYKGMII